MELNFKKFQGGAIPRIPLEARTFGARLENRSAFILDSQLVVIQTTMATWRNDFFSLSIFNICPFFFAFFYAKNNNNNSSLFNCQII